MSKIVVLVGSVTVGNNATLDTTRKVEFDGEEIATYREAGTHEGQVTDTRGVVETLYKTDDGRLIVHANDWSHWQREPTIYSLHEVTEETLRERFPFLADEAGMGRPLTLDEALTPSA
jgi:hypothetical protein